MGDFEPILTRSVVYEPVFSVIMPMPCPCITVLLSSSAEPASGASDCSDQLPSEACTAFSPVPSSNRYSAISTGNWPFTGWACLPATHCGSYGKLMPDCSAKRLSASSKGAAGKS
ncbi:hypothetical protein D3C81_929180 [compost metagenome]